MLLCACHPAVVEHSHLRTRTKYLVVTWPPKRSGPHKMPSPCLCMSSEGKLPPPSFQACLCPCRFVFFSRTLHHQRAPKGFYGHICRSISFHSANELQIDLNKFSTFQSVSGDGLVGWGRRKRLGRILIRRRKKPIRCGKQAM